MTTLLHPPQFRSHPLVRGGHLQTLATTLLSSPPPQQPATIHRVPLSDGDQLALHEDCPPGWLPTAPRLLLIHGLSGSHQTSYMARLAARFHAAGTRVFRLDMRGSGVSFEHASQLNHAGRSEDILRALEKVHELTSDGPIWTIGVSLGASQLLKMLGELGCGQLRSEAVLANLERAAAVAPPIDLAGCSRHMQRWWMRPYNRFFIHHLLKHIPPQLAASEAWNQIDLRRRPRTLYELDDRVTAPLSGYQNASHYYASCTADQFVAANPIPTLVLAADDDPIVPIAGFRTAAWPTSTELEIVDGGGHVAFLASGRERFWLDQRLARWFF